jgi:hypothetical protein
MMKVNRLVKALAVGLVSCSGLLISGCFFDSSSNPDSPQTPVAPPPVAAISNSYQLVLKDAVTGSLIADKLEVSFNGAAAVTAPDGSALNGTKVSVTGGLYALGAKFTATQQTSRCKWWMLRATVG